MFCCKGKGGVLIFFGADSLGFVSEPKRFEMTAEVSDVVLFSSPPLSLEGLFVFKREFKRLKIPNLSIKKLISLTKKTRKY